MEISSELQLATVSALTALFIGGAVAIFGHGPVVSTLARLAGFALRRRRLTTLLLGSLASGGIVAANAVGLEPPVASDAVTWFQGQMSGWMIS